MKKLTATVFFSVISTLAFAEDIPPIGGQIKTPLGSVQVGAGTVNIQGNTTIKADVGDQKAAAIGENNVAKNVVGAIKGGVNIKGNTTIKANVKSQTAIARGKNNRAENIVGQIGGN